MLLPFYVFQKALIHFRNQNKSCENNLSIPFFAAAIFLIHPIQTESVIYIISRSEIFASTFYLLGFLLFQIYLELKPPLRVLKKILLFILKHSVCPPNL